MDKSLIIPTNKHDFDAVEKIKNTDLKSIQQYLPQIFEWVEDINWPIAPKLAEVLVKFDDMIVPYLIDLIRNPDGLREYSVYFYMLPILTDIQLHLIKGELMRVAYNPSDFEKQEGYDKIALKYIRY
ncbi:DUF5071 domain-containing protein [Clostridium intestinale]|uniref:DUF5071 domain-containing protein n=1 Tax=Clostridium intestinale TaxID=36845 RepID=A0A7D6W2L0_9CLOT|nr:DUF5071 domain-containing protein [Clostridium intestinale]QLY81265.1 DUF5071 domain-containing protein [Clostridium intestinale]